MRTHIVDKGPNAGWVIEINQEFLFRGTDYMSFQKHVDNGKYWGSNLGRVGVSTFVAMSIYDASIYCGCGLDTLPGRVAAIYDDDVVFINEGGIYSSLGNRPILLAIAHERYPLSSPEASEGLIIPGRISLDDIVIVKTERDLRRVLPPHHDLDAITIQKIKKKAGIVP